MVLEPGGLLAWIAVGLIAGFLASALVQGHGFGLLGNVVLGIVGAFVGGLLATLLGWDGAQGFWGTVLVAIGGAAVILAALHLLMPAHARDY
jgi:uncharacterized membrane protein YeaQ/YmgE (transglycosylase-associated protein family)